VSVRIAIAQCAPALGAVKRNLDMHEKWIARAKEAGARLVVFPELSLTGYYLKDLAADVACTADDPQLLPIAEASRGIDISAGFVERSADAKLHIAQGHWSGGKLVHVHRKVYLPTYGIFDDGRYFGPGDRFDTYRWAGGTTGVAICEDLWHVSTPYLYAAAGATIVLAPSASPGRGVAEGGDLGTAESCRLMDRFYASYLTVYVVYVNRVGNEDGVREVLYLSHPLQQVSHLLSKPQKRLRLRLRGEVRGEYLDDSKKVLPLELLSKVQSIILPTAVCRSSEATVETPPPSRAQG